jgi:hypothetical protein
MKPTEQLFAEQQQPLRLLGRVRAELADRPGVVAVGIGFRRTGGVMSDEIVFRVFVEEKLPPERLAPADLIPPVLHGVPTDVAPVMSTFVSLQETIEPMTQRPGRKVSTLVGGVSMIPG